MAFNVKDPETDRLAREVARLTGESLTQAIRVSLEQRLKRERLSRGEHPYDRAAIDRIIEDVSTLPLLDRRSAEEIVGYDENGLPS